MQVAVIGFMLLMGEQLNPLICVIFYSNIKLLAIPFFCLVQSVIRQNHSWNCIT